MIYYAHRANTKGPNPETENTLTAINSCLTRGIRVEIDVRLHNGKLYLGHDTPKEEVSLEFLANNRFMLLIHCKDIETATWFNNHYIPFLHYFLHEDEKLVGTSLHYNVHHQNSDYSNFTQNDIIVDLNCEKDYSKSKPFAIISDFNYA